MNHISVRETHPCAWLLLLVAMTVWLLGCPSHVAAGSSQTRETIGPIVLTVPPGWIRSDVQGGNVSLAPPDQQAKDAYYLMIMSPSPAQGSHLDQHQFVWTALTMTYGKPQQYSTNHSVAYRVDSVTHHFHGSEMLGLDPVEGGPQWVQLWSDRVDDSFIAILCFAKSQALLNQHHADLQAILSSVARAAAPQTIPNPPQAERNGNSNSIQNASPKEGSLEEADALVAQTKQLNQQGRYREAIPVAKRALEIRKKLLGADDPLTAVTLNNLAELYRATGAYTEAETLLQRSLDIFTKSFGPNDLRTSIPAVNLGMLYQMAGNLKKARPLLERAVTIRENLLGPGNSLTGEAVNNLASFYEVAGNYALAEKYYGQALTTLQQTSGPEHPNTATALDNLGTFYTRMGAYEKALPLLEQAYAIRKKVLGPEHVDITHSLNNLGTFFYETGDYTKAEEFHQRALAIVEKTLGPEDPSTTISMNNLAVLYHETGANAKAEQLYRRILSIREKTIGPLHPSTANALTNLASVLVTTGSHKEATPLLQRALEIREQALGPAHVETAVAYGNLADDYHEAEDYNTAEAYYRIALERTENAVGKEHRQTALALNNLASLYLDTGAFAKAVSLLERAVTINEKAAGPQHPKTALFLGNLATAQWAAGHAQAALSNLERTHTIEQGNAKAFLLTGSEARKRAYMQQFQPSTYVQASLSSEFPRHHAISLSLTTMLQTKGLVLDAMADSVRRMRQSAKPDDRALFERLTEVTRKLSVLTQQGNADPTSNTYRQQLTELSNQSESLEAELSKRSAEFRSQRALVTLEAVQRAIPRGAALIEWKQYQPRDPKVAKKKAKSATQRYAAYVVKQAGELVVVDLGEAPIVDELVQRFRHSLGDRSNLFVRDDAKELYQKLMKPLSPHLENVSHLLVSPDGALNLIPFAALVDDSGEYLGAHLTITYLTSGRDLLKFGTIPVARGSAVVVANPEYGLSSEMTAQANPSAQPTSFSPLPGTAKEAQALQPLLNVSRENLLTEGQATETRFKQLHQPHVLHVATHGFFAEDNASLAAMDNPLLRSGLALAGANLRRSGDSDDGILTAAEVAQMDLRGTQLVVLSACETGVGDVQNGEGVYGLRRALVLAGAESQVTSLWKVADEATKVLMVDYYQRLLKGEGRSEALRNAQLTMMKSKDHSHPYYWAAFVPIGDWRPLVQSK